MINNEKVGVIVVQGRCLFRDALIDRLKQESWIEICATTEKTEELAELISVHVPQVVVMNISLKCCAGISSLRKLKSRYGWLSIVALSCSRDLEGSYVGLALRAGADAYISPDDSMSDLVCAVLAVAQGKTFMTESSSVQHQQRMTQADALMCLSSQEAEVFLLTGCGNGPQRVSEKMGIKVKTVETYRERIRIKLSLESGADLQYVATTFMQSLVNQAGEKEGIKVVRELLSTIDS